jgi:hypothetical protein
MKLPHRQVSNCSTCGKRLVEYKRKPCPVCKGTTRTIAVSAQDSLAAVDKAN